MLASLDDFLPDPRTDRDVTRVLRAQLFATRYGIVLVRGDEDAAARLVGLLARTLPGASGSAWWLDGPRLFALAPGRDPVPHESGDATAAQLLRALLRQDPEVLAVGRADAGAVPLLIQAALTGHMVLAGSGVATVDAFLALGADDGGDTSFLREAVALEIEVASARGGRACIRRVRVGSIDLVEPTADGVRVFPERLPPLEVPAASPYTPAPPLSERRPATVAARPAFVPRVEPTGSATSRVGAARILWPPGAPWPACDTCAAPLAHVVQLDLEALPAPLVREPGLVQLFVCAAGCAADERSTQITWVDPATAVELDALAGSLPMGIVAWTRVDEGPGPEDGGDVVAVEPLRCDKVGGWPAWAQGASWPSDGDGAPLELLFQWVEGQPRDGGSPARWDVERAEEVPAVPARGVVDPNHPRHFDALLTGEAVGLLFRSPGHRRFAFRWQTG